MAPLSEIRFALCDLASTDEVSALPGFEEATPDVVDAIVDEAVKFARKVLSPLNRVGNREGTDLPL